MKKIGEAVCADRELSGRIVVMADNPPPVFCGKDYNELLQKKAATVREEQRAEKTRTELHAL